MRKLFCLLSTVLLLFSCNDVDEFGRMLPGSVTLDKVRSISELTYEELDSLVRDEGLREEMRRNGGLLVQAQVILNSNYQSYDNMQVYYSEQESTLPPFMNGYWSELTGIQEYYGLGDFVYVSWYTEQQLLLPGKTIYCMVGVGLNGGEQMPGFVDEIQNDGYWTSDEVFSNVSSYTYPNAPVITEFYANGGDFIQAGFNVPAGRRNIQGWGICYSTSNPLPTIDDGVTYVSTEYDNGTYADVVAQVPGGIYNVRAFVIGTTGEVSYSPVQRVSCQGLMASVRIDSIAYVSDIPYNALASYLPAEVEHYQGDLRSRGGALIYSSASVEGSVYSWDMGLSVSATGVDDLPSEGYDTGYGVETLWMSEGGNQDYRAVYWQPATHFTYAQDRNDFHYQAAIGVAGSSGRTVWSYSDVQATVWNEEPVIESVYYYGEGNPFNLNMTVTAWGNTTNVGVCYSTTNDLPTLEQNDGVIQCPDTSFGYNVDMSCEFTLPAGTYYVRAYAQSSGGVTYSPVQQIESTYVENVDEGGTDAGGGTIE